MRKPHIPGSSGIFTVAFRGDDHLFLSSSPPAEGGTIGVSDLEIFFPADFCDDVNKHELGVGQQGRNEAQLRVSSDPLSRSVGN